MKKPIRFILLFTIFLLPLLYATPKFGYEEVKVLFFIFAVSLAAIFWLFDYFKNPGKNKFKLSRIAVASALFIVALVVTSISGIDPLKSIIGKEPYFQGLVLYAFLFVFFILISQSNIKIKNLALIYIISSFLVSLTAIREWVGINLLGYQIPSYGGRVVSTFGQPNFYAGFLLLSLPFFQILLKEDAKWPVMAGFLLSILAIILSESRVAFLLLSILLLIFLIRELPWKKLMFVICGVILLSVTTFAIFFEAGFLEKEFKNTSQTINPDLTKIGVEKRYYFWPILWEFVLQRPVLGYGLENIAPVFNRYFETNKHILFEENLKVKPYLFGLKDLYLDRSHNYILDLLLFSGILGLLAWIYLVALLFWKTKRNKILLVSLIMYLIWTAFQNQSVVHLIYFWLIVGLSDQQKIYGD